MKRLSSLVIAAAVVALAAAFLKNSKETPSEVWKPVDPS